MPDYRRWYVPGGTFFFTLVTCDRRPLLTEDLARTALRAAIEEVRRKLPFQMVAWKWSSFHRFVLAGEYTPAWGAENPCPTYNDPEWGE